MTQRAAPFSAWVLGIALVVGGLLFLVLSTGIVTYTGPVEPVLAAGAALLALPFVGRWLFDQSQWWALLTAYVFLMLALPVLLLWLVPAVAVLPIITVLVMSAVPFGVSYQLERSRWWGALAAYTLVAVAGFFGLTLLTASQEIYGAYGLIAAVIPLWSLYISDRSRTWAFVPAIVITVLAVLLLLVTGVVAVAQQGFFYTVVHAGLMLLMGIVYVAFRRFDWAAWLAVGFAIAAGLSAFFPPAAGFAALALTVGCYIIVKQIDAARQQRKTAQAAQKTPTPTKAATPPPPQAAQQPAPPPPAPKQQSSSPAPSGAQIDKQKTDAHREIQEAAKRANEKDDEGSPLAGFRPLNPFEGRDKEES